MDNNELTDNKVNFFKARLTLPYTHPDVYVLMEPVGPGRGRHIIVDPDLELVAFEEEQESLPPAN